MASKFAKIRPEGLRPDVVPSEVGPCYTSISSGVFRNGMLQKTTNEFGSITTGTLRNPRAAFEAISPANTQYWLVPGDDGAGSAILDVTDGTTVKDITPTSWTLGAAYTGPEFTGTTLNGNIVINQPLDPPVTWAYDFSTPTAAVALTGWPANYLVRSLRSYKDFLVGMNVYNGSAWQQSRIMWSDRATVGNNLPTAWTATATNEAGDASLGDSPGAVVDGLALGNSFVIYKDESAYEMQQVGLPEVMAIRKLFSSLGCLNANCIQEYRNHHFVVTNDDIVMHNGRDVESLADATVRNEIFDSIYSGRRQYTHTLFDPGEQEFWLFIATTFGTNYCDQAYAWRSGRWAHKDIDLTEGSEFAATSFAAAGGVTGTDKARTFWLVDRDGDDVNQFYTTPPTNPLADLDATIDGIVLNNGEPALVKRLWLIGDNIDSTSTDVYIGSYNHPQDPINWSAAVQAGRAGYKPLNFVGSQTLGRYHAVRVVNDSSFQTGLSGVNIEWEPAGRFVS